MKILKALTGRLLLSRCQTGAENAPAAVVKSPVVEAYMRPASVWQIHRMPDGFGGIAISHHVRDEFVARALKKVGPILNLK